MYFRLKQNWIFATVRFGGKAFEVDICAYSYSKHHSFAIPDWYMYIMSMLSSKMLRNKYLSSSLCGSYISLVTHGAWSVLTLGLFD